MIELKEFFPFYKNLHNKMNLWRDYTSAWILFLSSIQFVIDNNLKKFDITLQIFYKIK